MRKKGLSSLGVIIAGYLLSGPGHAQISAIPPAVNKGAQWRVVKDHWDQKDEVGYMAFVQAIGRSACGSLADCLEDEANPYRHTDKRFYIGDCADMVYTLRGYYAWKNGLPFSHQSRMVPLLDEEGKRATDPRFSPKGNRVAARRDAVGAKPIHGPSYIANLRNTVSTAMFRTDPSGGEAHGAGKNHDDFYSIMLSRQSVRPGAIAYDIYGHVGLVYDVTEDGRILIVAAHPDNTVTRSEYGSNFLRAHPSLGAGLKAWRPVVLKNARKDKTGTYIGGRVQGVSNLEISDFSLEQYYGNRPHPLGDWRYGDFVHQERTLNFNDFLRRALAAPGFRYNPVTELKTGLQEICRTLYARRVAVQRGVEVGIHKKTHPKKLPPNIYGTYGSWESYSTPSRDARLKLLFIELRRAIEKYVQQVRTGDDSVDYEGNSLEQDLWEVYEREEENCTLIYRRSDDSRVRLNLSHISDRLFDLSFDPYHCPELRWGARGVELETCKDGKVKHGWYEAEKYLRNQARRTYNVKMDFTLNELKSPADAPPEDGGIGIETPADADIKGYLYGLVAQGQDLR